MMNERQLQVCAIALFADGWANHHIADALGVDHARAQKLIEQGAKEQGAGRMGYMQSTRDPVTGAPVSRDPSEYGEREG